MKLRYDEPLGLPRGSVRGILAILLVAGFIAYVLIYKEANEVFMAFASIVGIVIGNYFGTRGSETRGKEPDKSLPEAV